MMLSFFKDWVFGVCFAVLAGGIIYAVSPDGTLKKSVKIVVALVVACSIILPFTKTDFNFDDSLSYETMQNDSDSYELESLVEYQITAAYSDDITHKVDDVLSSAGLSNCEITLMTDINEQGGIFIKKAYIELPDEIDSPSEEIQVKLYNLLGDESVIVFN